jgi:hypothetical protein
MFSFLHPSELTNQSGSKSEWIDRPTACLPTTVGRYAKTERHSQWKDQHFCGTRLLQREKNALANPTALACTSRRVDICNPPSYRVFHFSFF